MVTLMGTNEGYHGQRPYRWWRGRRPSASGAARCPGRGQVGRREQRRSPVPRRNPGRSESLREPAGCCLRVRRSAGARSIVAITSYSLCWRTQVQVSPGDSEDVSPPDWTGFYTLGRTNLLIDQPSVGIVENCPATFAKPRCAGLRRWSSSSANQSSRVLYSTNASTLNCFATGGEDLAKLHDVTDFHQASLALVSVPVLELFSHVRLALQVEISFSETRKPRRTTRAVLSLTCDRSIVLDAVAGAERSSGFTESPGFSSSGWCGPLAQEEN